MSKILKLVSWKSLILVSIMTALTPSCTQHAKPEMTQLQIREIQTRTFASVDTKKVLKEMINVLQDDAFIVKNANVDLGLLVGEKEIDVENKWQRTFGLLSNDRNASWKKNEMIEISANVTQFGSDTKVRVNIQKKLFDNFGRVMKVRQIYDAQQYQHFFDKVHKGLFIQQEEI